MSSEESGDEQIDQEQSLSAELVVESNLKDENYSNVEFYATNACFQLSNTMDKLLETNPGEVPKDEQIDRAIDCADALVKVMAMFHKGREIESKREVMNKGLLSVGYEESN